MRPRRRADSRSSQHDQSDSSGVSKRGRSPRHQPVGWHSVSASDGRHHRRHHGSAGPLTAHSLVVKRVQRLSFSCQWFYKQEGAQLRLTRHRNRGRPYGDVFRTVAARGPDLGFGNHGFDRRPQQRWQLQRVDGRRTAGRVGFGHVVSSGKCRSNNRAGHTIRPMRSSTPSSALP
jgi:hypothetical protein